MNKTRNVLLFAFCIANNSALAENTYPYDENKIIGSYYIDLPIECFEIIPPFPWHKGKILPSGKIMNFNIDDLSCYNEGHNFAEYGVSYLSVIANDPKWDEENTTNIIFNDGNLRKSFEKLVDKDGLISYDDETGFYKFRFDDPLESYFYYISKENPDNFSFEWTISCNDEREICNYFINHCNFLFKFSIRRNNILDGIENSARVYDKICASSREL